MIEEIQGDSASNAGDDSFRFHLRKLQRHPKVLATRRALRIARQFLPNAWRKATHTLRPLPNAVIVGVAKAGTTQLFSYLLHHPRCFGGTEKEINYFSWHYDRPLSWYRARFPLAHTVNALGGITMEASPSYLPSPDALQRMRDVLPAAKLVVVLRDPVDRAFSQYQHGKQRHRESTTFDELVRASIANSPRFDQSRLPFTQRPANVSTYIWQSYYALQIAALYQIFPREQLLIVDSADLFDDTNASCQRVFNFLGLEPFDIQPHKIYNRGYYREKIEPETAELLRTHYQPHDQWLVELTGQSFRWMNSPGAAIRKAA